MSKYNFLDGCLNSGMDYINLELYVQDRLNPEEIKLNGAEREKIEDHLGKCVACKNLFKEMSKANNKVSTPAKKISARVIKSLLEGSFEKNL